MDGSGDKRQRTTQPDAIGVRSPSNRKKKGVQEVRGVQEFKEKETGARIQEAGPRLAIHVWRGAYFGGARLPNNRRASPELLSFADHVYG